LPVSFILVLFALNAFISTHLAFRNHEHELRYHKAEKKIDYVDEMGIRRKSTKVNGIKLEKFIFDVFPLAK
jgi:UDP-N-acetylglucosamine/UDP-N-acetylgalactosamine diphosphorylase